MSTILNIEHPVVAESVVKSANISNVLNELKDSYNSFIKAIPISGILIPIIIFILSPDEERGIFLFGSIFTMILTFCCSIIINNHDIGKNFINTVPNIHSIFIGYLVGYHIIDHINHEKPGSLISALVFGLILLTTITNSIISYKNIRDYVIKIGLGFLLGNLFGILFGYLSYKQKKKIIKNN